MRNCSALFHHPSANLNLSMKFVFVHVVSKSVVNCLVLLT